MTKLSICIPTYFSSKFIKHSLNTLNKSKIVDEIVISDDSEDEEEFFKTQSEVQNCITNKKINLVFSNNEKNLGGFHNKYRSVSLANNEFVYLLDSDNIPSYNSLSYLFKTKLNNLNPNSLYIPSKIFLFKNYKYEYFLDRSKNIKFSNNEIYINKDFISDKYNHTVHLNKELDFILNVGNSIFSKSRFLETLSEGLSINKDSISAADAVAISYYYLDDGYDIVVSKFLSHYHRLRDNSYWVTEAKKGNVESQTNYFMKNILDLK